jgi:hypothetical protein
MRKLFLGLLGATALTGASAANATAMVTSPTTVSGLSGPVTVNNIYYLFGYDDTDTNSPFTETVSWMNDVGGVYGVNLITNSSTIDGPDDVDITAAFLTGTGILNPINLLADPANTDLVESFSLTGLPLTAGTYTLTIEGTRSTAGVFGGHVSFDAVPEPATWALMLLGFGAVGWQLRRRRSQVFAQAI